MRNDTQIQAALRKLRNVNEFARKHKLPLRTVWRVMAGGNARKGTMVLLDAALNLEKNELALANQKAGLL